ncbi:MAG: hypothetical protein II333_08535 [Clostridia bacterium]|nr:hypothetical protein [Clostridia bacterium]
MILGFIASLFGCTENPAKYGPWQSFSMNRTSMERTDAYHFGISREDDGDISITGYCFDGDTEYRADEAVYVSGNVRAALIELAPAALPTLKSKNGSTGKLDGVQISETVTHTDGTERRVSLTAEKRAELVGIFTEELKSAVESASHGEWDKLWLSFSSDNYSEGYDFEVKRDDSGNWIAVGSCSDDDYNRYTSEDGIVLSAETIEGIRALNPERYAAVRKAKLPDDRILPEGEIMLDGSSGGLMLGFADGYTEEKATSSETDYAIADLLRKEFAEKADPQ